MGAIYGGATYGTAEGTTWGSDFHSIGTGWWLDDLIVDALEGSHPELTRGEEVSLSLRFDRERDGASPTQRYEDLRERLKVAHAVALLQLIDGTMKFKEQHQEGAGTLLAKFVPGPEAQAAQGFWGLLVGYEDATRLPQAHCRVSLSVVVLADAEEYSTRQEVLDALAI